ncbi:MAG: hypothetical protein ABH811_01260 [archaeon]
MKKGAIGMGVIVGIIVVAIIGGIFIFKGSGDSETSNPSSRDSSESNSLFSGDSCGEIELYNLKSMMGIGYGSEVSEDALEKIECMTKALKKCGDKKIIVVGGNEKEEFSIKEKKGNACVVSDQQDNRYIECDFLEHHTEAVITQMENLGAGDTAASIYWFVLNSKLEKDEFEEGDTTMEFNSHTGEASEKINCRRNFVSADNIPDQVIPGEIKFTTAEETFKLLAEKSEQIPDGYYAYDPYGYVYSLDRKVKKVVGAYGGIAPPEEFYFIENQILDCSANGDMTICTKQRLNFDKLDSLMKKDILYFFRDHFEEVSSFEYLGKNSYGGKPCYEFFFTIDENKMSQLESDLGTVVLSGYGFPRVEEGFILEYKICLDVVSGNYIRGEYDYYNKGVPLYTRSPAKTCELWKYSSSVVTEESVKVPIEFFIESLECEGTNLKFNLKFLDDYSGQIDLKLISKIHSPSVTIYSGGVDAYNAIFSSSEIVNSKEDDTISLSMPLWDYEIDAESLIGNSLFICSSEGGCFYNSIAVRRLSVDPITYTCYS